MSSSLRNLSSFDAEKIPSAQPFRFALIVAEWNSEITDALYCGAESTLLTHHAQKKNVTRINVPGSFELVAGAQWMAETKKYDAVICLGCVIQGETRHFDFICHAVAQGLVNLGIKYSIPFIFGVLTPDTLQQAKDRAGGKHGNKGVEAAVTAIKMAVLKKQTRKK